MDRVAAGSMVGASAAILARPWIMSGTTNRVAGLDPSEQPPPSIHSSQSNGPLQATVPRHDASPRGDRPPRSGPKHANEQAASTPPSPEASVTAPSPPRGASAACLTSPQAVAA